METIIKIIKKALRVVGILFIVANVVAAIHAYKFTHFSEKGEKIDSFNLSTAKKIQLLLTCVDNPRPVNTKTPWQPYSTVALKCNVNIEAWYIASLIPSKGTVVLFHGYTSCKSALLDRAEPLLEDGYNCMLVDFMGSGGSGGNSTTIGFKEAEEVKVCFEYVTMRGDRNIFLYGSSMGAVAIMKAIHDFHIEPKGIIIECPFETMYQTVAIRFKALHVPVFPMAGLLVFWGGLENGFWAFSHNPIDYASGIHCPTLLQYGAKDDRVASFEITDIYNKLNCDKKLVIYPLAGHDDYLKKCGVEWTTNMLDFLNKLSK